MTTDNMMKILIGMMMVLMVLVGCQAAQRTVTLPTRDVVQMQDQPASVHATEPGSLQAQRAAIETVNAVRKACLERGSFWIKSNGVMEHFTCKLNESISGEEDFPFKSE